MSRPLRVLHVGNVANNGYLNAKLLRRVGVEADALCDEWHMISQPEWEDAPIDWNGGDPEAPLMEAAAAAGWHRPEWVLSPAAVGSHELTGVLARNALRPAAGRSVAAAPLRLVAPVRSRFLAAADGCASRRRVARPPRAAVRPGRPPLRVLRHRPCLRHPSDPAAAHREEPVRRLRARDDARAAVPGRLVRPAAEPGLPPRRQGDHHEPRRRSPPRTGLGLGAERLRLHPAPRGRDEVLPRPVGARTAARGGGLGLRGDLSLAPRLGRSRAATACCGRSPSSCGTTGRTPCCC